MHHPTPSPAGTPLLHIEGGVATITLNRPAHHNRLHVEDLKALQQHLNTIAADAAIQALVLTGTGPSFCSGFHLGSLNATPRAASDGPQLFEQTVEALEALPQPTVCRLNGGVYGGAIDLALACDFRVGVNTGAMRMPAVRLGLHYYPSGLRRYVSRLGLSAAKQLFLLAETLPAETMLRLGVLDRMTTAEGLDGAVQEIIEALCAGAPLAMRGMKASLNEIARGDADSNVLRQREELCAHSADLREGQAANAERRAPRFTGR